MSRPIYDESSDSDTKESEDIRYKYAPLHSQNYIRLLKLRPGSRKSPELVCELIEVAFDIVPSQEASLAKQKSSKTNKRQEQSVALPSPKTNGHTIPDAEAKQSTEANATYAKLELHQPATREDRADSPLPEMDTDSSNKLSGHSGSDRENEQRETHVSTVPIARDAIASQNARSSTPGGIHAKPKIHRVPVIGKEGAPKSYEALSWSWGRDPWESKIIIYERDKRFGFPVPRTLMSALRALRLRTEVRYLWVDALCIHQESFDEKNHQVPMMAEIYGKAEQVCVWLGESDEDSKIALRFITDEVVKLQDFDKLCENPDNMAKWNAMQNLMKRPWFSRRWVVQEISLANRATLYCGRDKIPWADFADAVQLFVEVETATHRLSDVMRLQEKFYHVPRWFEYVSTLGATLLVEATGTLFRYAPDGKRKPLLNLEYLVSNLTVFEASEPRDNIYALLAIAKDTNPIPVKKKDQQVYIPGQAILDRWSFFQAKKYYVDYEKPYVEVCRELVSFVINQQMEGAYALDILCRPWAPKYRNPNKGLKRTENERSQDASMPSWILPISGAAYDMFVHADGVLKMGRKNADSLVGLPSSTQRNYSAAGDRKAPLHRIRFRKRDQVYCMSVGGFILDTVKEVQTASQSGNIPASWFEACGWNSNDDDPPNDFPSESFWRTLVADRAPNGRNPPTYYARACKMSLRKGLASGALNTTDLIDNGRSSVVAEFFRRVQSVIWNRSLMETTGGHLGIVRADVKEGDLICILYGCSVPVILRPTKKTPENKRKEKQQDAEYFASDDFQRATLQYQRFSKRLAAKFPLGDIPPRAYAKEQYAIGPQSASLGITQSELSQSDPTQIVWHRNHPGDFHCEFLGEAYVHDMMDGEAITYQNNNNKTVHSQIFDLR